MILLLLVTWLIWLLTSVTETAGSAFSTSTSSMIGLFLPPSLAAFLRRIRLGRSQRNAVIVMRASRPKMPPAAMTAMIAVERPPADAVMVSEGNGLLITWRVDVVG